jgi:hypothetical protein
LNPQPKTRAERTFHLVERALLRTLLAGKSRSSIFSHLPFAKGNIFIERGAARGMKNSSDI